MWARMVVARWWVQWLVSAALTAVVLSVVAALLMPNFFAVTGRWWGVVAVTGFSLLYTACIVLAQRPIRHAFAAAVAGLDLPQRTEVSRALRRGHIPGDPAVLAAAIRVGRLRLALQQRASRSLKWAGWVAPVAFIGAAVLDFLGHQVRPGVFLAGLALYFATYCAWWWYRYSRLARHLTSLRAAAAVPQPAATADAGDGVAVPARRGWAVVALILVIGVGTAAVTYVAAQPKPGCRTADAVLRFNAAHGDLLTPRLSAAGTLNLGRYQDWSDHLHAYARQPSSPDIAPHLQRIADLSTRAVASLRDIANESVADPPNPGLSQSKSAYRKSISQLLAEEHDILSICHPGS